MANRLLFTFICDDVRLEQSGKLLIVGLYNRSINMVAPPPGPQGAQKFALPQLCIVRRWNVDPTDPGNIVNTSVIGPGPLIITLRPLTLVAPPDFGYVQDISIIPGFVLEPGLVVVKTEWGNMVAEEQFEVNLSHLPTDPQP